MRDFIITAIVALAAAKAKAKAEDNVKLTQPAMKLERPKQAPIIGSSNKKGLIAFQGFREKNDVMIQTRANPEFNNKKHPTRQVRF